MFEKGFWRDASARDSAHRKSVLACLVLLPERVTKGNGMTLLIRILDSAAAHR
jgi:hypothetical protein